MVTPALLLEIERTIVAPSVAAIAQAGITFKGTLFIGIMLTAEGPRVLEYNTRFGDPETQVVLPRIRSDLLELLWAAATGTLKGHALQVSDEHALCVVIAARGYPEATVKGDPISLPAELPPRVSILHAGTAFDPHGRYVSAGGRILGVTATAPSLREAADKAYAVCEAIQYAAKVYRRDIGARQLNRR